MSSTWNHPARPPVRPPLQRAGDGRVVAGVAQGVARHLGVDVWIVRAVFVFLSFSNFAGVVAYAALWALVTDDEQFADLPVTGRSGGSTAAAADRANGARASRAGPILVVVVAVTLAALVSQQFGFGAAGLVTVPVVVAGLGVAMLWRVADDTQRDQWRVAATATSAVSRSVVWFRLAGGLLLVGVGVGALLLAQGGFTAVVQGLAATTLVLAGAALVTGPWLYRLTSDAAHERRERIRSQERAEIAAHVHDSVLQTLTLVQRNADDPREVVRLARAEERALRGWLYEPRRSSTETFAGALDHTMAEVETTFGGTIDVVVVGDSELDERLDALLKAAREAAVNSVKYAGDAGPVSVYAEVADGEVSVFVRDRGTGFDLAEVPADRHGLRESIVGRTERQGGRAVVRASPGAGTEIELVMPKEVQ